MSKCRLPPRRATKEDLCRRGGEIDLIEVMTGIEVACRESPSARSTARPDKSPVSSADCDRNSGMRGAPDTREGVRELASHRPAAIAKTAHPQRPPHFENGEDSAATPTAPTGPSADIALFSGWDPALADEPRNRL
jgi:hypothetical protein